MGDTRKPFINVRSWEAYHFTVAFQGLKIPFAWGANNFLPVGPIKGEPRDKHNFAHLRPELVSLVKQVPQRLMATIRRGERHRIQRNALVSHSVLPLFG